VVNTAARAQSAAGAGQILVTQEVYRRAQPDLAGSQGKAYRRRFFNSRRSDLNVWKFHDATKSSRRAQNFAPIRPRYG
jgi:class 3 adenylate cyclase